MTTRDPLGELARQPDGTYTIRFTRRLPHPPERIWSAITDPAEVSQWWAEMTLEPHLGGTYHVDFGEQGEALGNILHWDPPRLLEHSWTEVGVTSHVRWELTPDAGGTILSLTHTNLPTDNAHEYGAGWHAFLSRLPIYLEGGDLTEEPEDFEVLMEAYSTATSTT